eukprot:TRINITY_DN23593_c0_g2_i1.p1 TRINITY_DN23593_c0_g2~~TRINITY_DN23593_c0_g2_i1.p1  ORF type:complete len:217 (+),score=19.25 TRINITY_DN23593_c0_g2_i1:64-651(+)
MAAAAVRAAEETRREMARHEEETRAVEAQLSADVAEISEGQLAGLRDQQAVVFVYADWCTYCPALKPAIVALKRDPPVPGLLVARIKDSRAAVRYATSALLQGQPATLFVDNGRVVDVLTGVKPEAELREWAREAAELSDDDMDERAAATAARIDGEREEQQRQQQQAAATELRRKEEAKRKAKLEKRRRQARGV